LGQAAAVKIQSQLGKDPTMHS